MASTCSETSLCFDYNPNKHPNVQRPHLRVLISGLVSTGLCKETTIEIVVKRITELENEHSGPLVKFLEEQI